MAEFLRNWYFSLCCPSMCYVMHIAAFSSIIKWYEKIKLSKMMTIHKSLKNWPRHATYGWHIIFSDATFFSNGTLFVYQETHLWYTLIHGCSVYLGIIHLQRKINDNWKSLALISMKIFICEFETTSRWPSIVSR